MVGKLLVILFCIALILLSGCLSSSTEKNYAQLAEDFCDGTTVIGPVWSPDYCINEDQVGKAFHCSTREQACFWVDV